jgi:alpha-galactosidase/6-phospho-beta-glucosidase family protein
VKNIFDLPFSEGLLRSLNLLPCSYLQYYFKSKEMLGIEMGEYYKGGTRAQVVQEVEKISLKCTKIQPQCETESAGDAWRGVLFRCRL